MLRAHGHGIEELSTRELCDVAYATIVSDLERQYYALLAAGAKWEGTSDPLGDQVTQFEERIGLRDDPAAWALEQHKAFLAAQGKEWDDTPVTGGSGEWWDQDVEFTSMSDLDRAANRRGVAEKNSALFSREE